MNDAADIQGMKCEERGNVGASEDGPARLLTPLATAYWVSGWDAARACSCLRTLVPPQGRLVHLKGQPGDFHTLPSPASQGPACQAASMEGRGPLVQCLIQFVMRGTDPPQQAS